MAFLSKIQAVSADGSAKTVREIGVDIDHVLMAANGDKTLRTKLSELDNQIPSLATGETAGLVKVAAANGLTYNDNLITLNLATNENPGSISKDLYKTINEKIELLDTLVNKVSELEGKVANIVDGEQVQF